ncbi:phosphopantetheine-binding protein [Photorhabdus khanii]|nr:phosphopantetheine-binding protein [Photorhabdus khanii]
MKIIGTPQVGRNGNFFNLGGDSILSIRMNSQIRHVFNMHVDNSTVFNNPTLAGFAAVIAEQLAKGE